MTVSAPQYQNDIVNTGSLKMKKEKFLTTFSSIEVYCDGKTVWTLLTEEEEMIVSDYDPVESMGVDQIFQIYGDSVDSKYEGVVSGMDKVSLISHNSESNYGKVELWISKTTKLIVKATMIARNGSKYTYDFKNIETNLGIPDSEFVIDHNTKESEGWIVDDER